MLRVQYFQDGEPMVEDCIRIEAANTSGDLLITFSEKEGIGLSLTE